MIKKRGMSTVVVTILLVALTIVVAGIVWAIVNNLVEKKTEEASSCFNLFEKITLNNDYTCYDSSEGRLHVSVDLQDIELDKLIIGITGKEDSFEVELGKEGEFILPAKNEGNTYSIPITEEFGDPVSIRLTPVIKGNYCSVVDETADIRECE